VNNIIDAPQIAAIIDKGALCGACIARRAGVPRQRVDRAFNRISGITADLGRCDDCLKQTVVHRLA